MRRFFLPALLAIAPLSYAADETRELPGFTAISSQGAYRLVVTAGQKQSVVVSGDEGTLANLVTKVVGNELVISMPDSKGFKFSERTTISIGVPELSKFQMEGAGRTELHNLAGESFQLNFQGVGSLQADGKVQRFVLKGEGVGSLNARELDAQYVHVTLQGVGSAKVRASNTLMAKLEGVGSLTYYGRPTHVTKSVDGVGSIRAGD